MGRISIDESLCQGTGSCLSLAPDAIELDELGIARVVDAGAELPDAVVAKLVSICPSMAITRVPGDAD